MPPLARLTLHAAEMTAPPGAIARARHVFRHTHVLRLPGLLAPDLLAFLHRDIEAVGFHERVHTKLPSRPRDLALNRSASAGLLTLTLNGPEFLALARTITGRPEIGSLMGTVHRRVPGAEHEDAWHNDMVDGRVAVLSINLGPERHEGGVLQIRAEPDGPIIAEVHNPIPGDAVLFPLGDEFRHRVTNPEGAPRTVFAGFFRTESVKSLFGLTTEDAE